MLIQHTTKREFALYILTARMTPNILYLLHRRCRLCDPSRLDQKTRFSVANNLFSRTTPVSYHWCTCRHSFNRHQTEGLIPFTGEKQALTLPHQLPEFALWQLPHVSHAPLLTL